MSSLSADVVKAAKSVVREAVRAGQGDTISKKILIQGISKRLKLPDDHFNKQQKGEIANLARTLLEEAEQTTQTSSPRKPSASPPPKANKKAARPKMESPPPSDDETEEPAPKRATQPKKRKSAGDNGKKFRTAEFINSEGDPVDAKTAGFSVSDGEDSDRDVKPKKKAKTEPKPKDKKKEEKKPRASKKAAEPLDSEEEELKRLKSFVVACGERKIWSKEFAKRDLDMPRAQIRWLKELLNELGMPSRMSLQAAKDIGAKRALEKEARELGIELNKSEPEVPRTKRAAAQRKPPPPQQLNLTSEEEDSDGTAEEAAIKSKKKLADTTDEEGDSEEASKGKKGKAKKGSGNYEQSEEEVDDSASPSSGFQDSDSD